MLVGALDTTQPISEDCQFLTFYTPTNITKESKLPVFYWYVEGVF
jgi:carboxylesterase type B